MQKIVLFVLALIIVMLPGMTLRRVAGSAVFTIVVDAGHGGIDRGASSKNGTFESDINLAIAGFLKEELRLRGAEVVMTRGNKEWLALDNRRMIIERAKPDLVISIHLNNFPSDTSVRGLQCFYDKSSEVSQSYARAIQTEFNKNIPDINRVAKAGDYYILNSTAFPSVLVECGFLSNAQEEKLLKTAEYQRILAYYIAASVCAQFLAQNLIMK